MIQREKLLMCLQDLLLLSVVPLKSVVPPPLFLIADQEAWETANPSSPSLDATIEAKIGGALKTALLYLLKDPIDLFCMKIKTACSGLTCDEEPLSRILGGIPDVIIIPH